MISDVSLRLLQKEVGEWSRENFPDNQQYHPLLGVSEEVGELCHAHLKMEQGIALTDLQGIRANTGHQSSANRQRPLATRPGQSMDHEQDPDKWMTLPGEYYQGYPASNQGYGSEYVGKQPAHQAPETTVKNNPDRSGQRRAATKELIVPGKLLWPVSPSGRWLPG